MLNLKRMWVNQPSTQQIAHHWHGRNVLASEIQDGKRTVWFTEGVIISAEMPYNCLSDGWNKQRDRQIEKMQTIIQRTAQTLKEAAELLPEIITNH